MRGHLKKIIISVSVIVILIFLAFVIKIKIKPENIIQQKSEQTAELKTENLQASGSAIAEPVVNQERESAKSAADSPGLTVTYPAKDISDAEKLVAVYSLIGQMTQYKLLLDQQFLDNKFPKERWRTFVKVYDAYLLKLFKEKERLRNAIRLAHYTDDQWDKLSGEQRYEFGDTYYGNRQELQKQPTTATSVLLDSLKAIDINNLQDTPLPPDPVEDPTSYVEVDTAGYLTLSSTKVIGAITGGTDSYVYKDFGAGYFNAIDLLSTITYQTSMTNILNGGNGFHATVLNDATGWGTTGITQQVYTSPTAWYRLYLLRGARTAYDYYEIISMGIPYYTRMERAAGADTATLKIYASAANRAADINRIDTLSVSGFSTNTFRYFYFFVAESGNATRSVDVEDVDLQQNIGFQGIKLEGLKVQ